MHTPRLVRTHIAHTSMLLLMLGLAGCVALATTGHPLPRDVGGATCASPFAPPPAGLVEASDDVLLKQVLGADGKGMLCAGKVYRATGAVAVYRVWDASKPYTLYGGWWSFQRPEGPRERYRTENDICPEWSALDRMSACRIKSGALVVVGPGQSADCANGQLPRSPANQVYIPNDARNDKLYVEACTPGDPWP